MAGAGWRKYYDMLDSLYTGGEQERPAPAASSRQDDGGSLAPVLTSIATSLSRLDDISSRIDALSRSLEALERGIENLEQVLGGLERAINCLEQGSGVDRLAESIKGLQSRVDALSASVSSLPDPTDALDALSSRLASLEETVSSLSSELQSLRAVVEEAMGRSDASLRKDLVALARRVTALERGSVSRRRLPDLPDEQSGAQDASVPPNPAFARLLGGDRGV